MEDREQSTDASRARPRREGGASVRSSSSGPASMTQTIIGRLRRDIIDGAYAPGTWIRQEDLARQYGVSRVPIRQALHALEGEGWVAMTAYAGARVLGLSLPEAVEIYLMRERLEPLALMESIPRLADGQIETLRNLVAQMEEIGESDILRWLQLDTRFHLQSYEGAPLPRLLRTIEGLWDRAQQYRRAAAQVPAGLDHSHTAHRLILEAIEQRNLAAAEHLLTWHIQWTRYTLTHHAELLGTDGSGAGEEGLPAREARDHGGTQRNRR